MTITKIKSVVYFNLPRDICEIIVAIIQSDRKVTQPIPDTYSVCQKRNYNEIRKQKIMLF
jgi:hypothetical protein